MAISYDNKAQVPTGIPIVNKLARLTRFFMTDAIPHTASHTFLDHCTLHITPSGYLSIRIPEGAKPVNVDGEDRFLVYRKGQLHMVMRASTVKCTAESHARDLHKLFEEHLGDRKVVLLVRPSAPTNAFYLGMLY
eukprot:gene4897-5352_t